MSWKFNNEREYISEISKSKKTTITDNEYYIEIKLNKFNVLLVYYYFDNRDKYDVAYKLLDFFENDFGLRNDIADSPTFEDFIKRLPIILSKQYVDKGSKFIEMLKDPSDEIPGGLNYDVVQDVFKTRENYHKVKKELLRNINKVKINYQKREKTFDMIDNDNKDELKTYFSNNNIQLKKKSMHIIGI